MKHMKNEFTESRDMTMWEWVSGLTLMAVAAGDRPGVCVFGLCMCLQLTT